MTNHNISASPNEPLKSRVAWGAIFAGALFAMAILFFFGSLTLVVDYSINENQAGPFTRFWALIVSLVAMFAGGMATSRLAQGETVGESLFHGVMVWTVGVSFLLYLAVNGFLVLGSTVILGQPSSEFGFLTRGSAMWAFSGVVLSLLAALMGALFGTKRQEGQRSSQRTRKIIEVES